VSEAEDAARRILEANYGLMNFLAWLGTPAPSALCEAAGLVVNAVCTKNGMKYNHGPNTICYTACFLLE
jgi:hypothetical protein